jgi:hypothetical protein
MAGKTEHPGQRPRTSQIRGPRWSLAFGLTSSLISMFNNTARAGTRGAAADSHPEVPPAAHIPKKKSGCIMLPRSQSSARPRQLFNRDSLGTPGAMAALWACRVDDGGDMA